MRKIFFSKHPIAWGRWTIANLTFIMKDQHLEKSKQRIVVGYGAITDHFKSTILYKKDDAGQKQFMKDLLFVAKMYMPISIVENLWLKWLVMHQNPQVQFSNQKQMV